MSWEKVLKWSGGKKQKYPFGRPLKPKEKAKQFVLETIKKLPWARLERDRVILEPIWAKRIDEYFYFDMKDINNESEKMCLWVNQSGTNKKLCLSKGSNPNNAVPADFYVTLMMIIGNEKDFTDMWGMGYEVRNDVEEWYEEA
tara:strand:- start:116 stop:544 length:429 start_codon:yes stop_codon:yes gene_type:complete